MESFSTKAGDNFFHVLCSLVERELNFSATITMVQLVDLSSIMKVKGQNANLTYTGFLIKAIALALRKHPEVNMRHYRPLGIFPRRLQVFQTIDMAVANEIQDPGLTHVAFLSVLHNVQDRSLDEIQDWLQKHRNPTHTAEWKSFANLICKFPRFLSRRILQLPLWFPSLWGKFRGGAVVISSPGKYGVDQIHGSWFSPLGFSFGYVKERPISFGGSIQNRPSFYLTFNFDRRLITGAQGALFFNQVVSELESFEGANP